MDQVRSSNGGPVVVTTTGEVFVNGVKAPLRVEKGVISFIDKDRRRCAERGGRVVSTSVHDFVAAIQGTIKGGSSGE